MPSATTSKAASWLTLSLIQRSCCTRQLSSLRSRMRPGDVAQPISRRHGGGASGAGGSSKSGSGTSSGSGGSGAVAGKTCLQLKQRTGLFRCSSGTWQSVPQCGQSTRTATLRSPRRFRDQEDRGERGPEVSIIADFRLQIADLNADKYRDDFFCLYFNLHSAI
jgi:hypothetical protein